jgi:hypothetical protein
MCQIWPPKCQTTQLWQKGCGVKTGEKAAPPVRDGVFCQNEEVLQVDGRGIRCVKMQWHNSRNRFCRLSHLLHVLPAHQVWCCCQGARKRLNLSSQLPIQIQFSRPTCSQNRTHVQILFYILTIVNSQHFGRTRLYMAEVKVTGAEANFLARENHSLIVHWKHLSIYIS